VDTPEALVEMLQELKSAKEIAVDLEHHDQRSYIGFVCLMQISTRKKDWIVDTLKLRGELQILNEIFADPKIIKVGLINIIIARQPANCGIGSPRSKYGHHMAAKRLRAVHCGALRYILGSSDTRIPRPWTRIPSQEIRRL
jgi:hypothetical protein